MKYKSDRARQDDGWVVVPFSEGTNSLTIKYRFAGQDRNTLEATFTAVNGSNVYGRQVELRRHMGDAINLTSPEEQPTI